MVFVVVAVVTKMEGFRTLGELTPAFVFHTVSGVLGAQLLVLAARRDEVAGEAVPTA